MVKNIIKRDPIFNGSGKRVAVMLTNLTKRRGVWYEHRSFITSKDITKLTGKESDYVEHLSTCDCCMKAWIDGHDYSQCVLASPTPTEIYELDTPINLNLVNNF